MAQFVNRDEWGAAHPKSQPQQMTHRKGHVFHWWGSSVGAIAHNQCASVMRSAQQYHMRPGGLGATNGGNDIAYNWVICQHGYIFVARGENIVNGANGGYPQNNEWEAVCFMVGQGDAFTNEMSQAGSELATHIGGERRNHRDLFQTECPGNVIASWQPNVGSPTPVPTQPIVLAQSVGAPNGVAVDGDFGPQTVRALQTALNDTGANPRLVVDGIYGLGTQRALQGRLNATNGPVAIDGKVGPQTIRALQAHVGATVDGTWGAATTRALQIALNEKRL